MAEELAQYDMQIIYRKGKEHGNADALSRLPDSLYYCDCYKAGAEVDSLPCGGCPYCTRAHTQWGRFEEDVDDVVPLAVASPESPRVNVCAKEGDSNWADVILPEQQGEEQELDPDLKVLRSWIKGGKEPQREMRAAQSPDVKGLSTNRPLLKWKYGVLWYLWKDREDRELFLVPRHMRKNLLRLSLDNSASGHSGREKTVERLRRNFHRPSLSADVERYVKACAACNRSKHLNRRPRAPLQSYTAGYPMEKAHMDILGPLPDSRNGNKYALLMVDQFTIEAAAIPDQIAETVARAAIDYLFSRMGCPREICTDQGTNFGSQLFTQLCELLEIAKKRTTPYHPSVNGQVERINSTLLQMIRCNVVMIR